MVKRENASAQNDNLEIAHSNESGYDFARVLTHVSRATELLDSFTQRSPRPTWAVSDRLAQALKRSDRATNPSLYQNYWKCVVAPSFSILDNGKISDSAETTLTPSDKVLLSSAIQGRFPHNRECNLAVSEFVAGRILDGSFEVSSGERTSSLKELLQVASAYEGLWIDCATPELIFAGVLLKGNLIRLGLGELERVGKYMYDRHKRYETYGWSYLPHLSIVEALKILTKDPTGRKMINELSGSVKFQSIGRAATLSYYIEQVTQLRTGGSGHQMLQQAIHGIDPRFMAK